MVYVIGRHGDDVAYPVDVTAALGVVHDVVGGDRVVLVPTSDGLSVRAYFSSDVTFVAADTPDDMLRSADGRSWRVTEDALVAFDGQSLPRIEGHNAFWFGFVNQSPGGRLFDADTAN